MSVEKESRKLLIFIKGSCSYDIISATLEYQGGDYCMERYSVDF